MDMPIGEALAGFEGALRRFRKHLEPQPDLLDRLLRDDDWPDLLTYKLVPHLGGKGCLVAAVTGGTNTGKSTIFNILVGGTISPVVNTAAATCHPLLAANAVRAAECLEGKLVPEFRPMPLENPLAVVEREYPDDALFVAVTENLPHHLVVMDTPDVDSIDKQNWEVAEHIRAAGDVLVAVVTGEKYKDERVVRFFREAHAAGRVILPVMNKANPERDFEVARKQLAEFCNDVGIKGPTFVVAHDFNLAKKTGIEITPLGKTEHLRAHLEGIDVRAVKENVFRGTVRHFAESAGDFLDRAERLGDELRETAAAFDARAREAARHYDPAPGAEVGHLFHEFVQSKRGPVRRAIGTASSAFVRTTSAIGRRVTAALRNRATLDAAQTEAEAAKDRQHRRQIERIARDLAASYFDAARSASEPASRLLEPAVEALDVDAAVETTIREVLATDDVSEAFRAHAMRTLNTWWDDHRGRRTVLEALDIMLAIMPAAIAAPISVYTGGIGASEAVVAVGPFAAQFVTRVMEYQFADAMFDFLSPWKQEQQAELTAALRRNLTEPILAELRRVADGMGGEALNDMRRFQQRCLAA